MSQETPIRKSVMARDMSDTFAQNESRGCEADETKDSRETENAVDEDGGATISTCVVTKFGGESPVRVPDHRFELFIFYLEWLFDDSTRQNEVDEEEKRGRGGEECWDCKGV